MSNGFILVGDIGGTNARFALARRVGRRLEVSHVWKRPGADFASFDAAVSAYLATVPEQPVGAAFGFAGPVVDGRVKLLHRDWSADRRALAQSLSVERVVLVNDFHAMARAAPELDADGVNELSPGVSDPSGSIVVSGPGTGFGVAVVRRFASVVAGEAGGGLGGWIVLGGEGGHQAFAPQTEIEWKLAERLRETVGYVSNEIVASGSGFEATLMALADAMGVRREALTPDAVIARAEAGDALCVEMCRLRARTVMTSIGNTALASNATGGIFVAGGVSVKIARWLKERTALDRFYQRGARTELMSRIPIRLITTDTAPLSGAALLWLDEQERGWL